MDQAQINSWWVEVRTQGNRKAFDRIYLSTWRNLYAQAWRRVEDEDVAKDMVQDVFVKLWEGRHSITITGTVPAYLHAVLKNRIMDYFQSENVLKSALERAFLIMESVVDRSELGLSYEETEGILEEELAKMPKNMRETFLLRLDNQSIPMIAQSLNLADQTVNNLLTEARRRLKENLPRRFENHHPQYVILFLYALNEMLTYN